MPPSYAQRFAAAIPDAKVEPVADAAHQVPVDQPEKTAELVKAFIQS